MAFLNGGGSGGYKPRPSATPSSPVRPGPTSAARPAGQPSPYSETTSAKGGLKTCPNCGHDLGEPAPIENNPAIIQHYIDTLDGVSSQMSDWERSFFKSIKEQFETRGSLSPKQVAALSKIYAAKT